MVTVMLGPWEGFVRTEASWKVSRTRIVQTERVDEVDSTFKPSQHKETADEKLERNIAGFISLLATMGRILLGGSSAPSSSNAKETATVSAHKDCRAR